MKKGDLIKVRYRKGYNELNDPLWTDPCHGVIFEAPTKGVWKMWCIETRSEHIIRPTFDNIEILYEANTGD